jgi:hypothetical protein
MMSNTGRASIGVDFAALQEMVTHNQVWPIPPWKTSLDGLCDALDHAACDADVPTFKDRRDEEDTLSAAVYPDLPYPESQLVSLAHSLLSRGVVDEYELVQRLSVIRARLEG